MLNFTVYFKDGSKEPFKDVVDYKTNNIFYLEQSDGSKTYIHSDNILYVLGGNGLDGKDKNLKTIEVQTKDFGKLEFKIKTFQLTKHYFYGNCYDKTFFDLFIPLKRIQFYKIKDK